METIITFNFSHGAILGFMYQSNRGLNILGSITSRCSGSKPALLPWRHLRVGAFEQKFSKNSNAQGVAWGGGGDVEASIWLVHYDITALPYCFQQKNLSLPTTEATWWRHEIQDGGARGTLKAKIYTVYYYYY